MLQHDIYYKDKLYHSAAPTLVFGLRAQRVKVSCGLINRNAAGHRLNLECAVSTLFTSASQASSKITELAVSQSQW